MKTKTKTTIFVLLLVLISTGLVFRYIAWTADIVVTEEVPAVTWIANESNFVVDHGQVLLIKTLQELGKDVALTHGIRLQDLQLNHPREVSYGGEMVFPIGHDFTEMLKWHKRYGRFEEMQAIAAGRGAVRFAPRDDLVMAKVDKVLVQREGRIITENGLSVQNSACCYCQKPLPLRKGKRPQSYEKVLTISTVYGDEFAHFFKEMLPRLVPLFDMIANDPTIKIHIRRKHDNKTLPQFMRDAFEMIDIDVQRLVVGDIFAKELYIPGFTSCGNVANQYWRTVELRDKMLRSIAKKQIVKKWIVIIERNDHSRDAWQGESRKNRFKLIRQAAAKAIKTKRNYGLIRFSDEDSNMMNCFKCQVELFSGAVAIIGQHGAGLTHTMFMPKGGLLVEIGWEMQQSEYLILAHMFGHRYYLHPFDRLDTKEDWAPLTKLLLRSLN